MVYFPHKFVDLTSILPIKCKSDAYQQQKWIDKKKNQIIIWKCVYLRIMLSCFLYNVFFFLFCSTDIVVYSYRELKPSITHSQLSTWRPRSPNKTKRVKLLQGIGLFQTSRNVMIGNSSICVKYSGISWYRSSIEYEWYLKPK